jgi:opacity protein-like surface antigen
VEDKMKKKMLAISVAAVAAAGSAAAADLPRGPAPYYYSPAPSFYNWSGFYAGLNLGYEWGKVTNGSINPTGVAGAIRVWRRNRHPGQCSRRHFRTMEIFQPLVWHPAGSSWVRDE